MSTTVRELINVIGWKVDKNQLNKAEATSKKFMNVLKTAGVAIGIGIVAIGVAAVKAAADMEAMTAQFEVMLGSSEKAVELMNELKTFAAKTPFALKDLAQGTQNLISFGVPLEDAVETMRMLGDTAGGNAEKLKGLVLAYGKVQAKGKVSMEEINMVAEKGVPIIETLRKQLGVTEEAFFKLVSAGKIGRDEMKKAFQSMTSEGGKFFKGMEVASLTFNGIVSTMKDNITLLLADIGNKLLPVMKEVVGKITELMQGSLGKIISDLLLVIEPILKIVLELAETLLNGIMPLVKTLSDILVPLLKLVSTLLEIINPIIEILLDGFGDVIQSLAKDFVPLLEEISKLLIELMPILLPIIKILSKLTVIFIKLALSPLMLRLKFMAKGLTLILKVIRFIIKALKWGLGPAFEGLKEIFQKIAEFVQGIFDKITKSITWVITNVMELINLAIDQINKLPFMEGNKLVPFDVEAIQNKMIKKDESKTTDIKMTNNNTFNGVDNNKKGGIKNQVRDAISTPFQLEILRVIQELG